MMAIKEKKKHVPLNSCFVICKFDEEEDLEKFFQDEEFQLLLGKITKRTMEFGGNTEAFTHPPPER